MFIQTNTTDYKDTAIKTKMRVFIHPPQKTPQKQTKKTEGNEKKRKTQNVCDPLTK